MISIIGWFNGLSLLSVLISQVIFGLFFIYKSKITDAKRLKIAGLTLCFLGLAHMECSINFIYYLITGGNNLVEIKELFFLINSIMVCFEVFFANYLGIEILLTGKKKKIFLLLDIILGIIFLVFLIVDLEKNFTVFIPPTGSPTEGSMIWNVSKGTPFFFTLLIWLCLVLGLLGFGCFYKGLLSERVIRKKYFLLSFGTLLVGFSQMLAGTSTSFVILTICRIIILPASWMWYLSLREEQIKIKKNKEKKVSLENDLFRLFEAKPENITEEDVMYHKERKICLVCKGKVEGFTFICPKCDALYCQKCAQALISIENACWACNGPIDKSKPVKNLKSEEENIHFLEKKEELNKLK